MQRLASCRIGSRFIEKQHLTQWISVRCVSAAASEAAVPSDSTASIEKIVIPKKINRSSVDLLRALSETVGRDPTMPHYKFHDDPYLIPQSINQRHLYALTQESGRKAAKWIVQEHAELFNVSDPRN